MSRGALDAMNFNLEPRTLTLFWSLARVSYAASSLACFSAPTSLNMVTRWMSLDILKG